MIMFVRSLSPAPDFDSFDVPPESRYMDVESIACGAASRVSLYQDLNGIQLERDHALVLGWQKAR